MIINDMILDFNQSIKPMQMNSFDKDSTAQDSVTRIREYRKCAITFKLVTA